MVRGRSARLAGERARDRARGVRRRGRRGRPTSRAVGVAGCVPCLLLLDAADAPLRPALLYNDGRAEREISELRAELGDEAVLARTGAGVTQQSIGPKLRWLARHEPGNVNARAAHLRFLRLARRASQRRALLRAQLGARERPVRPRDRRVRRRPAGRGRLERGADVADPRPRRRRRRHHLARWRPSPACAPATPVVAGLADHVASAFGAGLKAHGEVLREAGRLGRPALRHRPAAGGRAALPRRAPAAGAVAAERLHGHAAARPSAGSSASWPEARRWRSSTPRRPASRPAPTGSCCCRTCSARRRP